MITCDKQQAIREILLTWTNPKPEYSGVNAWTIAGMILEEINREVDVEGH